MEYFSLKFTKENLTDPYDFYCDGTFLYIKTNGKKRLIKLRKVIF